MGIRARETNNMVERLHGTFKDQAKPMRGLKNDKSSQELLDGYVINYNFCRKHSVIKSTPAEITGLQELKGWKQLIEKSQHYKISQEQVEEKEQTKTMEVKAQ